MSSQGIATARTSSRKDQCPSQGIKVGLQEKRRASVDALASNFLSET